MWCLLEHIFLMQSSYPLLVSTLWKVGEKCSGWQQASASLGVSSTAYLAAQRCSRGPWQRRRERRPSRRGSGRPPRKGLTRCSNRIFFVFWQMLHSFKGTFTLVARVFPKWNCRWTTMDWAGIVLLQCIGENIFVLWKGFYSGEYYLVSK